MGDPESLNCFFDSGPFGNQAAFDAVGADANPTCRAVHQGSDGLQVRAKYSLRPVISMTHVIAHGMTFGAQITNPSHTTLLGRR